MCVLWCVSCVAFVAVLMTESCCCEGVLTKVRPKESPRFTDCAVRAPDAPILWPSFLRKCVGPTAFCGVFGGWFPNKSLTVSWCCGLWRGRSSVPCPLGVLDGWSGQVGLFSSGLSLIPHVGPQPTFLLDLPTLRCGSIRSSHYTLPFPMKPDKCKSGFFLSFLLGSENKNLSVRIVRLRACCWCCQANFPSHK
jgi:hypothetical protein